jgi:hypothetical protein
VCEVQAVRHKELVMVVEGVRRRLASAPSPDPILLINFPDLDNQFKAGWSMQDSFLCFPWCTYVLY